MTKAQFALITAALGVLTMGGAGYIAYANTAPSTSSQGTTSGTGDGAASGGQQNGANGGTVQLQSSGTGTDDSTSAVPQCVNGDVKVSDTDGQGAAGTISLLLIFQNVSGHRCSLDGYPGAAVVGPGGEVLLNAQRFDAGQAKISVVTLDAGGRASALLEWSDVPGDAAAGGCAVQNAANLLVTPPNFTQSQALSIGTGTDICSAFEIQPVLKGMAAK